MSELVNLTQLTRTIVLMLDDISRLHNDMYYMRKQIEAQYESKLREKATELYCRINTKVQDLEQLHKERVRTVRLAFRQQLANALAGAHSMYREKLRRAVDRVKAVKESVRFEMADTIRAMKAQHAHAEHVNELLLHQIKELEYKEKEREEEHERRNRNLKDVLLNFLGRASTESPNLGSSIDRGSSEYREASPRGKSSLSHWSSLRRELSPGRGLSPGRNSSSVSQCGSHLERKLSPDKEELKKHLQTQSKRNERLGNIIAKKGEQSEILNLEIRDLKNSLDQKELIIDKLQTANKELKTLLEEHQRDRDEERKKTEEILRQRRNAVNPALLQTQKSEFDESITKQLPFMGQVQCEAIKVKVTSPAESDKNKDIVVPCVSASKYKQPLPEDQRGTKKEETKYSKAIEVQTDRPKAMNVITQTTENKLSVHVVHSGIHKAAEKSWLNLGTGVQVSEPKKSGPWGVRPNFATPPRVPWTLASDQETLYLGSGRWMPDKKPTEEAIGKDQELQTLNRYWEKKFAIVQASMYALKDESYLRRRLERQATALHQVAVRYATDAAHGISGIASPEKSSAFRGSKKPLPDIGKQSSGDDETGNPPNVDSWNSFCSTIVEEPLSFAEISSDADLPDDVLFLPSPPRWRGMDSEKSGESTRTVQKFNSDCIPPRDTLSCPTPPCWEEKEELTDDLSDSDAKKVTFAFITKKSAG